MWVCVKTRTVRLDAPCLIHIKRSRATVALVAIWHQKHADDLLVVAQR